MLAWKILSTLLLTVVAVVSVSAQHLASSRLYRDFGKVCNEEVQAVMDGFLGELRAFENSKGYIVFHGDRNAEGRNVYYIGYMLKYYPASRKIDESKLILLRGEDREKMSVQFWIVPAGGQAPNVEKEFTAPIINETSLYDRNWADFYNGIEGKGPRMIYQPGFFELGCEFPPNAGGFAQVLLENPDLTGYVITYTKFGRGAKRGNAVSQFAVNELVRDYKVPRKRLKMIYGGNRTEPEIEFWLLPKGGKPPIPTPEKRTKAR